MTHMKFNFNELYWELSVDSAREPSGSEKERYYDQQEAFQAIEKAKLNEERITSFKEVKEYTSLLDAGMGLISEKEEKETFERYEVIEEENFYHSMIGKLVYESGKTYGLEFNLNEPLGGLQRVQFFKSQLRYYGKF